MRLTERLPGRPGKEVRREVAGVGGPEEQNCNPALALELDRVD